MSEHTPVAWSVFDKRTKKYWYTNESEYTAQHYEKEYSHQEPDNTLSMVVVPLYSHPTPAVVRQLVDALRMVLDDPNALDGRPRTYECVQEALAAAKEAGL